MFRWQLVFVIVREDTLKNEQITTIWGQSWIVYGGHVRTSIGTVNNRITIPHALTFCLAIYLFFFAVLLFHLIRAQKYRKTRELQEAIRLIRGCSCMIHTWYIHNYIFPRIILHKYLPNLLNLTIDSTVTTSLLSLFRSSTFYSWISLESISRLALEQEYQQIATQDRRRNGKYKVSEGVCWPWMHFSLDLR